MTTEAEGPQGRRGTGQDLDKKRRAYRLVDGNGTVAAGAWDRPDDDYFGLWLADIGKALEAWTWLDSPSITGSSARGVSPTSCGRTCSGVMAGPRGSRGRRP
jgi:hypothetical protein